MSEFRRSDCPFCGLPEERILAANGQALAIADAFPVSPGHALIVSRRHVESFFDLNADEVAAIMALLHQAKAWIDQRHRPRGYNVGINIGPDAGQTVMHVHVHLIPRYIGDVAEPLGGVRNIILGMGSYASGSLLR